MLLVAAEGVREGRREMAVGVFVGKKDMGKVRAFLEVY